MANATMWREMTGQGAAMAVALPELRARAATLPAMTGTIHAGGCGDSLFAAQAALEAFAAVGVEYRAASALEMGHLPTGGPKPGDWAILVSISGGTTRTVEAAERLAARGVNTLAVTCSGSSALDSACSESLVLPYTPISRATPHTADYLVSLLALVVLAERGGEHSFPALDAMVTDWETTATPVLEGAREVAAGFDPAQGRLVALGGLGDLGTAAYGAAKFHEAGGLGAIAMESENFMHGANFTLSAGDLVVPIAGPTAAGTRAAELTGPLARLAPCRPVIAACHASLAEGVAPMARLEAVNPITFVFHAALALQGLCWFVVEQHCPDLEIPRAGFAGSEIHAEVQTSLLKKSQTRLGPNF